LSYNTSVNFSNLYERNLGTEMKEIPAEELPKYLDKIDKVFNISQFRKQKIESEEIREYYEDSDFGYRLFHSAEGSIHMALNFDGVFSKEGYYGQAKLVDEFIQEKGAKTILELASGKGFNSIFLAEEHPSLTFIGIDLTPKHVAIAKEKSENIPNVSFKIETFQNLSFASERFDLLFEVESICHATDMELALSEAYRVLKPGGYFILFDGFRNRKFNNSSIELKTAAKLVELSMAVGKPWDLDKWVKLARKVGFSVDEIENISYAIMPNLLRFQVLARGFFKYKWMSKVILKLLPHYLVQNAIAGLLMPLTIKADLQGYFKIILKKG
jgi:ubiquinone/menaquinone biosynthesis C-methylase UbiE